MGRTTKKIRLFEHMRIVVDNDKRNAVIEDIYAEGWNITHQAPQRLKRLQYSGTRTLMLASREVKGALIVR